MSAIVDGVEVTFEEVYAWFNKQPGPGAGRPVLLLSIRLHFSREVPAGFRVERVTVSRAGNPADSWVSAEAGVAEQEKSDTQQYSIMLRNGPSNERWPAEGTTLDVKVDLPNYQSLTYNGAPINNVS
eukprot:TRINITY_DN2815_c0_g1_i2.p1 TRINITY_DN2815_c0_g1~~TRINITY_DN2815_c0_g1_i2.p1  ORF type:complete len:127 (+),score=20.72 TRINITY_DN2815_c0_g1_i2:177-557(+)